MTGQSQLLASLGVDPDTKREMSLHDRWLCYSLNHDGSTKDIPIILITQGPKSIGEVKKAVRGFSTCIIILVPRNTLLLKAPNASNTTIMENESEYERIASVLESCDIARASSDIEMQIGIVKAIDAIPNSTGYFDNRGVFSTHYLRTRLFDDIQKNISKDVQRIKQVIEEPPDRILDALGWKAHSDSETVSIVITKQDDFSIKSTNSDVAPSYTAISKLQKSRWVILTNGRKWRLYTNRISAASTNYFEITAGSHDSIMKYLVAIFDAASYEEKDGQTDIDRIFDEGKNYATSLEEDLASRIMSPDGLFLDIVKGVLDHDMKKLFGPEELDGAKQTSIEIMYRVWFLAYAESRNLLPIRDEKYRPISLQSIRSRLDSYGSDPEGATCWADLLRLFDGIRNGSVPHNLPQYSGVLFSNKPSIDGISIQNRFIVPALSGLLEKDGEPMDYASLGVRHLGSIFESLMEFVVRQAEKNLMLLEDKDGVREVKTEQESTYSYKKNDLYLASRGGIVQRKMTATFYTPNEIVEFLVRRGLEPIFAEREKLVAKDVKEYDNHKTQENLQACMDRILDIQVLDPAMGSGHFLVEALNQITTWATSMLDRHPRHPLLDEIEADRNTVLSEQKKKGIIIDESLLTYDVLLKRKIMKRCIFGVDLNPTAVELAKLALWLDSFAIGVPLTFMDHHIKLGDSTIGLFLDDLKSRGTHTLDDFMPDSKSNEMICNVISNSDVTIQQAKDSEDGYYEHRKSLEPTKRILDALTASKIDPKILPKKGRDEFIHRFGRYSKTETAEFAQARRTVNGLAERHRFFHWETEMMDAFTDSRRGFDLVVGNPPWDKVKPSDDEFFPPYYVAFRDLKPNTKKKKVAEEILKDPVIAKKYEEYKAKYREKSAFYSTYDLQGIGHKDLWKLVLERAMDVTSENGMISMVIPSQLVSNAGGAALRKEILDREILSLYVFENKRKIFPIDSRYRFVLLSVRNGTGPDEFPAGFYLHHLESLNDNSREKEKFGTLAKSKIIESSPDEYIIPESVGNELDLIRKMSKNNLLESGIGDGWSMSTSRLFNKTNDSDLLSDDIDGWPVHEGKTVHQYSHTWSNPEFTADRQKGLERESKRRVFAGKYMDFYNSYRLVFRQISSPTNMRTVISTIVPPHTFHTDSLNSFILKNGGIIATGKEYNTKICYICGVLNSLCFDFASRAKMQVNLPAIIKSLSLPKPIHEKRISELAAKMVVGTPEFAGLAESMRVQNVPLTPAQRIETAAEIDALVAHSYGLTLDEYLTITESFPAFKKNPELYDLGEMVWSEKTLKDLNVTPQEFYGEMADLAISYFEVIS